MNHLQATIFSGLHSIRHRDCDVKVQQQAGGAIILEFPHDEYIIEQDGSCHHAEGDEWVEVSILQLSEEPVL
jgi:hypothetical protein